MPLHPVTLPYAWNAKLDYTFMYECLYTAAIHHNLSLHNSHRLKLPLTRPQHRYEQCSVHPAFYSLCLTTAIQPTFTTPKLFYILILVIICLDDQGDLNGTRVQLHLIDPGTLFFRSLRLRIGSLRPTLKPCSHVVSLPRSAQR